MKRNIIIAWSENCSGPGWVNSPIWYIEELPNGKLERGCLQPEEQTKEMISHFGINALSSQLMTSLVMEKLNSKARKEEA